MSHKIFPDASVYFQYIQSVVSDYRLWNIDFIMPGESKGDFPEKIYQIAYAGAAAGRVLFKRSQN